MLLNRQSRWTALETGRAPLTVRQMAALTFRFPRRGRGFWYGLAIDLIWPFLVLFTRTSMRGGEHIPASGPVLIASNHLSFADPITVTGFVQASGRVPRYLARADLWAMPVVGAVMAGGRHVPVHRGTASVSQSYQEMLTALRAGECVVIFPEGTFSDDPDHWPMRGKTGLARLALETGVPVVPVANWGTHELLPPSGRLPRLLRRPRVHLVAGPPVDLSDLLGPQPGQRVQREATRRIMTDVTTLLGEVRGEAPPARLSGA